MKTDEDISCWSHVMIAAKIRELERKLRKEREDYIDKYIATMRQIEVLQNAFSNDIFDSKFSKEH